MKKLVAIFIGSLFAVIGSTHASVIGFENGDFEQGLNHWITSGDDVGIINIGGDYGKVAALGLGTSSGNSWLAQTFTISPDIHKVAISFDFLFLEWDASKFLTDWFGSGLILETSSGYTL